MAVQHIRSDPRPAGVEPAVWARIAELRRDDEIPDVPGVIAEQEPIEACYQHVKNGIFWFTRFYIAVTKGVHRELAGGHPPARGAEFLERLDIRFYVHYRNALCETDVTRCGSRGRRCCGASATGTPTRWRSRPPGTSTSSASRPDCRRGRSGTCRRCSAGRP